MVRSIFCVFLLSFFTFSSFAIPNKKKIVFIAGKCSHGPGEHEGYAACMLLAGALNKIMPGEFETVVYRASWPGDEKAFDNASAIVMYVDGGPSHMVLPHLEQVNALMKKGVGFVCLHYAVEIPMGPGANYFLDWLGGYFETNWSVNPMWMADYKTIPKHAVTRGVKPFSIKDEWYYHMRFRQNMSGITPLLIAIPPASTLDRKDGPHENNAFVRAEAGKPQITAWASKRPDGGRGFGFTGSHYHENWANDNFRKLVLNGIAWVAHVKIPAEGLVSATPTAVELKLNLDDKPCPKAK
jgi:type 1 glutamine amidotransferase